MPKRTQYQILVRCWRLGRAFKFGLVHIRKPNFESRSRRLALHSGHINWSSSERFPGTKILAILMRSQSSPVKCFCLKMLCLLTYTSKPAGASRQNGRNAPNNQSTSKSTLIKPSVCSLASSANRKSGVAMPFKSIKMQVEKMRMRF